MQVSTSDVVVLRERVSAERPRVDFVHRVVGIVEQIHQAGRGAPAIIADGVVIALAVRTLWWGPLASIAVVACSLLVLGRSYAERSTLETQGIAWYWTVIAGPMATLTVLLITVAGALGHSATNVARYIVLLAIGVMTMRTATWACLVLVRRARIVLHPALIVGEGVVAQTLVKKLVAYPEAGLRPAGVVSLTAHDDETARETTPDELPALIDDEGVDHLLIVPERHVHAELVQCLEACAGLDLQMAVLPPLADLFINPRQVSQVGGLPLLPVGKPTQVTSPMRPFKRLFDIAVSAALLLLLAPVLVITAIAVKFEDRGPILFRQRRIGLGGRPFHICKFRSMHVDAEARLSALIDLNVTDGLLFKVQNDPRVTRVGALIRRLSIDELPQLWNVLKGDMSLVGPRPLAAEPSDFSVMDGRRHCVPPGITGYWQVAGGNGLTYQEMIKLDLAYIQNWSLWLDIRLLAKTVPALVHRRSPW